MDNDFPGQLPEFAEDLYRFYQEVNKSRVLSLHLCEYVISSEDCYSREWIPVKPQS